MVAGAGADLQERCVCAGRPTRLKSLTLRGRRAQKRPGRPAQGLTCKGSVYALAVSAPGNTIVAGTAESLVRVFDARTGAKVMKLRGHTGNVRRGNAVPPVSPPTRWLSPACAAACVQFA